MLGRQILRDEEPNTANEQPVETPTKHKQSSGNSDLQGEIRVHPVDSIQNLVGHVEVFRRLRAPKGVGRASSSLARSNTPVDQNIHCV